MVSVVVRRNYFGNYNAKMLKISEKLVFKTKNRGSEKVAEGNQQ